MKQAGFFDVSNRYESLSKFGDPLEKLNAVVDFEAFRPNLEKGLSFSDGSKGGRPAYDAVLMFKILILQSLYNLSDEQTEFQIKDRLSFMRFLGLQLWNQVPDAKTVWLYRERLKNKGLDKKLFEAFDQMLKARGYLAMSGQIVDATVVSAPRQRMTKAEKAEVKAGNIPEGWQAHPAKLSQKDRDARWFVKYSKSMDPGHDVSLAIPFFGYKNHISTDKRYGFIRKYEVTDASCYDGKILPSLLDKGNTARTVWGDTAYRSLENEGMLANHGFTSCLHRKKPKGKPMSARVRQGNRKKSTIRAKVEHVFAIQKEQMGLFIRTIGIQRATVKISLANIAYNMKRLIFWEKQSALAG
jgi:IS5 family transposase